MDTDLAEDRSGPEGPTIVVIDDSAPNVELVRRVLQLRPAIRVAGAGTGTEGLALARAEHPAIVLLDLQLPDMEGSEVQRQLKADPVTAGIAVVVLSGSAGADVIRRTRQDGADDYLTKPFDVGELLDTIDRLLTRRTPI